jgi:hypothetical protein
MDRHFGYKQKFRKKKKKKHRSALRTQVQKQKSSLLGLVVAET